MLNLDQRTIHRIAPYNKFILRHFAPVDEIGTYRLRLFL